MYPIDICEFENMRSNNKDNIIVVYDIKTGKSYFAAVDENEKSFSDKELFKRFEHMFGIMENVNIRKYWIKE